jgi:hypothetical protein
MSAVAPVLGVVAGVLGVAEVVPYVRDTVRRSTRPHRGTWLIWSVLAGAAFWAQRADGASWSLLILGVEAVGTSVVFALSIRLGSGALSPAERGLVVFAGAGVVGWLATDEPLVATICVIASDVVATSMMLPKTWREPGSETLCTYVLASAGGAAAAASVGAVVPSLLLYPVYFCLVNGAVACLIVRRRAELGRALAPGSALQCTRAVRSGTAVQ